MKNIFEDLDQYDFVDDEYIEKVKDKYTAVIGLLVLKFSKLEHSLNLAIAEILGGGRSHDIGYVVVERLSMDNKIELFHKIYISRVFHKGEKYKQQVLSIADKLKQINYFRNSVVHANWVSLDKKGNVRIKVVIDRDAGYIKFRKNKLTPSLIKERAKQAEELAGFLGEFMHGLF